MGNVLLHLEQGKRLDINCTKLLNDEVRTTRKSTNNRDCMNVTAVSILDSGLKISFGKFSEKYPTSFRSLTSNQRRVRDLRNVLLQLDVIRTRHLARALSCQKKKYPIAMVSFHAFSSRSTSFVM